MKGSLCSSTATTLNRASSASDEAGGREDTAAQDAILTAGAKLMKLQARTTLNQLQRAGRMATVFGERNDRGAGGRVSRVAPEAAEP